MHTEIKRTLDVSENPFHQVQVRLARSVHVETRLLDSMCDVRTRKRQVLECAGIAPVLRRIR